MSEFYVQDESPVRCAANCQRPATHRVMRTGKIDYGLYCRVHAEQKVKSLEARARADSTR